MGCIADRLVRAYSDVPKVHSILLVVLFSALGTGTTVSAAIPPWLDLEATFLTSCGCGYTQLDSTECQDPRRNALVDAELVRPSPREAENYNIK